MVDIIRIDDPEDPRIAAYRSVRERDLVGRDGCFLAEGAVVLAVLAASARHRTLSVFLDERRLAGLAATLARLPDEVPVYVAERRVVDAVAGFPLHRGILALGRRAPDPDPNDLLAALGPRAMVVVAAAIANHDNIGGLFRNAAAFGADAVLLDADCCDPFYRKAIRVSVGHVLSVPSTRIPRGVDPVGLLVGHGFEVISLSPSGRERLADLGRPPRVAALFGAEGPGLSAELLARTRAVSIPMAPGVDSLNVAVTAGIVLHHLTSRSPPGDRPDPSVGREPAGRGGVAGDGRVVAPSRQSHRVSLMSPLPTGLRAEERAMAYTIDRLIADADFEAVDARVRKALGDGGFGVLTEIDVKATMKKKLDVDMPGYRILGACNPTMAHRAIGLEPRLGAMLPCNVILRAVEGGVEVSAIDPVASMAAIDNPALIAVAGDVRKMLADVVAAV